MVSLGTEMAAITRFGAAGPLWVDVYDEFMKYGKRYPDQLRIDVNQSFWYSHVADSPMWAMRAAYLNVRRVALVKMEIKVWRDDTIIPRIGDLLLGFYNTADTDFHSTIYLGFERLWSIRIPAKSFAWAHPSGRYIELEKLRACDNLYFAESSPHLQSLNAAISPVDRSSVSQDFHDLSHYPYERVPPLRDYLAIAKRRAQQVYHRELIASSCRPRRLFNILDWDDLRIFSHVDVNMLIIDNDTSLRITDVPEDLVRNIMYFQTPKALVRLMMTCKRMLEVGKTASTWSSLRIRHKLPGPKPLARIYKTDYDIFMRKACRCCFAGLADQYGFCGRCRWRCSRVACAYQRLQTCETLQHQALLRRRNAERRLKSLVFYHEFQREECERARRRLLALSGKL